MVVNGTGKEERWYFEKVLILFSSQKMFKTSLFTVLPSVFASSEVTESADL